MASGGNLGLSGRSLKPKKPHSANRSTGRGLDRKGAVSAALLRPADLAMDGGIGAAGDPVVELGNREREERSQVHTQECMTLGVIVNPPGSSFLLGHSLDNEGMDIWPQRARFRERETEYRRRTGETQDGLASKLETTIGNYRNWLYRKDKRPGLENLQKAAALFECSVTEFIDDPGAAVPAGINPDEWGTLGDSERAIMRSFMSDLLAIPKDRRKAFFDLWRQGIALGQVFQAKDGAKGGNKP